MVWGYKEWKGRGRKGGKIQNKSPKLGFSDSEE